MKLLLLAVSIPIMCKTFGQSNLVINNSFENAYNIDSLSKGKSFYWSFLEDYKPGKMEWASFYRNNGSDIFDPAPDNLVGYQMPQDGNTYAGFGVYDELYEGRDYLIGALSQPLEKGETYKVSFYLSLANCSKYAVNSFGVSFSNDSFLAKNSKRHFARLSELPVYYEYTGEVLSDTANWIRLEGEFNARGGEEKIVIGCFKADADLIVKQVKCKGCKGKDIGVRGSGYYLIDNVSLIKKEN